MNPKRTLTHWGAYDIGTGNDGSIDVAGRPEDPDPASIIHPVINAGWNRVESPAVRQSWLDHGVFASPERRGDEPLVDVDWDTALNLAAEAIRRVRTERGNSAIYGGSYGWGSAGRFHHPQSQLKRFLNTVGGFTGSHGTYSHGTAEVVVPRVTGMSFADYQRASAPSPDVVARSAKTFISLGGFPAHNTDITSGGDLVHWYRPTLRQAAARGCRFISVSPTFGDFDRELGAEWIPVRPGTDAALLMSLASHLISDGEAAPEDGSATAYLDYLHGRSDGVAKNATWASEICGVSAAVIEDLASSVEGEGVVLNATWSTQRVEHGEQTVWALLALGALHDFSQGGGGVACGYGSMGSVGAPWISERPASLPQGTNPVTDRIPVARIADALLHPGETYSFDGALYDYPHLDAIYWCGGNPFHHHQDLYRLNDAWKRPRAVLVNEPSWSATAQRADIVFPSTFGFERVDLGGASTAKHLIMMEAAVHAPPLARNDYDIFSGLAERLGTYDAFTEGRTAGEWIEELYQRTRTQVPSLPTFDAFVADGVVERPPADEMLVPETRCELDPSEALNGVSLHPTWFEPAEWLGDALDDQIHLVSPMPANRLHSQHGGLPEGLPDARMHPIDISERKLEVGQNIVVRSSRGALRAVVALDEGVARRVVSIDNGYPFMPAADDDRLCEGGNVNALTADRPSSSWAQATTAHSCLVRIELPGRLR